MAGELHIDASGKYGAKLLIIGCPPVREAWVLRTGNHFSCVCHRISLLKES